MNGGDMQPLFFNPLPNPASDKELADRIVRTLFRTAGMIRKIMGPVLEKYGISVAQWVVLRILFDRGKTTAAPIRLVDLSHFMIIRQPSLTTVVNTLALMGLVERVLSTGDRRERQVRLTPQGERLVNRILIVHRKKQQTLLSSWDSNEKRQVLDLLEKLWNHLEPMNRSDEEKRNRPEPSRRRNGLR
jgi:DNA-binding MarR family transcriptional regulator